MLQKYLISKILYELEKIRHGGLKLILPGGQDYFFGDDTQKIITLEIHDPRVLSNLVFGGDAQIADDYRHGLWDCDDLTGLCAMTIRNQRGDHKILASNFLTNYAAKFLYFLRRNNLAGSARNIEFHYDLGNEFYQLWLDKTMTYSAAIFDTDDNLESAQRRKYNRIVDNLAIKSGKILEIGCGWGGFAHQAISRGDYDIRGLTLSREQWEYAQNRLGGRAQFELCDYRLETGKYDAVASIEMFEAVGKKYWQIYFDKIRAVLNPGGRAVIQTITIDHKIFADYENTSDFIRHYIFPGGLLPSPELFQHYAQKSGFICDKPYFFGHDYAQTLKNWQDNFHKNTDKIKNLGFDAKFIRLWDFYFAGCIAGFETQNINVMQIALHPQQ